MKAVVGEEALSSEDLVLHFPSAPEKLYCNSLHRTNMIILE